MANNITTGIAWTALIVSVIALILAWSAYNQVGDDVLTEVGQELAKAEARAELVAIRAEVTAQENYQKLEQEVSEARQDLRIAYENAKTEAQEEWQEIDSGLEQLENDLRTGSANAANSLERAISALERDLRTDER